MAQAEDQPIKKIVVVSDGTGETANQILKAALVQFSDTQVQFIQHKNIRSQAQIEAICDDAKKERDLVVFTVVSPELRSFFTKYTRQRDIPSIDLLGPLLAGLANHFDYEPKLVAGLLHNVNEQYYDRIDAMEYTIAHDDGRDLNKLEKADLVILGISRTSKTPLSMYLSHKGLKVANIPIIIGFPIPEEVLAVDPKRVIGLTIDPDDLAQIRRARLQRLGQEKGGEYADSDRVHQEIEYANEIFRKNRRWPVFNVTGKALEETASEIIKIMTSRGLTELSY